MKLKVSFQDCSIFHVDMMQEDNAIPAGFGQIQTITDPENYEALINKPSINGVELIGNKTSEDLNIAAKFPTEGNVGDILMKTSAASDGVSWVTPASDAEQDNTRPITSAAVYTEIGNINALLATI